MKRFLLSLIIAISYLCCAAQANVDLHLAKLMRQAEKPQIHKTSFNKSSDTISILIDADEESLTGLPIKLLAYSGGIGVVRCAIHDLNTLKYAPGVKALRSNRQLQLHMDQARTMGQVDPVQQGYDLPQGYDGTGVTVGIIDVGFDPNHAAFSNADGTNTRIRHYQQFMADGAAIIADTPEAIALITTDDSTMFHATHTTSIAAGGYAGGQYYGVAPNADIVMAAIDLELPDEDCVLIGSKVTADKIKELGQPGVMSMSIGSLGSPHDESNPSARFLDAIAADIPFCLSAGNDGHNNVCTRLDFTSEESELWVLSYAANLQYLTFWSTDDSQFTTTAYLYPKDKVDDLFGPLMVIDKNLEQEVIALDTDPEGDCYSDILAQYVQTGTLLATSAVYEGNGKYYNEWYIEFEKIPEDESKRIFLAFKIEAEPGVHVDCYAEAPSNIFYRSKSGNLRPWAEPIADGSISTLALGPNILSIGACDSQEGDAAYFTSWGSYQMADRTLPVVLAPGLNVVGALSHYPIDMGDFKYDYISFDIDGKPQYYGPQTGTSMSSPFVAGVIALWLQANPNLTVDEIKEIIEATSVKNDHYYADENPARWGAGIINAYEGMKYILAQMGISSVSLDSPAPLIKVHDGYIEITMAGNSPFTAALYDLSGRLLATSQGHMPISDLQRGIHILKIVTNAGQYSYKINL